MTPINTLATELHLTRQALIQKLKRLGFSSTPSGEGAPASLVSRNSTSPPMQPSPRSSQRIVGYLGQPTLMPGAPMTILFDSVRVTKRR
jgi:hypothetical protein